MTTVLQVRPKGFVNTPAIEQVTLRALRYLQSGFSVHLRGPAGTGKTTLAMHLADLLTRPIVLMFGDDELKSTDFIGNQSGYSRKKVVDNYIHSVIKMEDELKQHWVDSRLTVACREGFTLVYDEFNRSRPEVNNVLLSALEEKLVVLPPSQNRSEYIRVHPEFRAILTSNPEEYCGVYGTQDALLDRLITINMPEPDQQTQEEILVQKIGITQQDAKLLVQLIKNFLEATKPLQEQTSKRLSTRGVILEQTSGLRPGLMMAKVCHEHAITIHPDNREFQDICFDVLLSRTSIPLSDAKRLLQQSLQELSTSLTASSPYSISSPVEQQDILPRLETQIVKHTPQLLQPALFMAKEESQLNGNDGGLEEQIYSYLQQVDGARVSEIELALGLNRIQTTDALRSLLKKGYLRHQNNRLFVVQM